MFGSTVQAAQTYHINRVNVGKLRKELTTAEGELGIGLEELLSGEKRDTMMTQVATWQKSQELTQRC